VRGCQGQARWQGCLTLLLSVPALRRGRHIYSVNVISQGRLRVHGVTVLVHELVDVHETSSHTDDDALILELDKSTLAAETVNTITLTLQPHQMDAHLQRGGVYVLSKFSVNQVLVEGVVNQLVTSSNEDGEALQLLVLGINLCIDRPV